MIVCKNIKIYSTMHKVKFECKCKCKCEYKNINVNYEIVNLKCEIVNVKYESIKANVNVNIKMQPVHISFDFLLYILNSQYSV